MFAQTFGQLLQSRHFYQTWGHAFAGALMTMAFGMGMSVCGPLTWLFSAGVFSFLTLAAGFGTTILARQHFGLSQVGKLAQLGIFWVFGMIAAWIAGLFFSVTISSYAGASLMLIVFYLLAGVPTGHIKQYLTRSWMPVKHEHDAPDTTDTTHKPTTTEPAHEADATETVETIETPEKTDSTDTPNSTDKQ